MSVGLQVSVRIIFLEVFLQLGRARISTWGGVEEEGRIRGWSGGEERVQQLGEDQV